MDVHLVDGTYELFRHFYAVPSHRTDAGEEVGAARAVVASMLSLVEGGATHVGVATDHVIESFRNELWAGYKSSEGIEPVLLEQFGLLEEALEAAGFVVWAMTELEADDALAAAATAADADDAVTRVLICTPDKDLAQCVREGRVVQFDRRRRAVIDEDGVVAKFGVRPVQIPDWLALVGDSADGFPGLRGWGPKSAAALLARYAHIEDIPGSASDWDVNVRGADRLARTLAEGRDLALLFRRLATLVADAPLDTDTASLRWTGPTKRFRDVCQRIDAPDLVERAEGLR